MAIIEPVLITKNPTVGVAAQVVKCSMLWRGIYIVLICHDLCHPKPNFACI